MEANIAIGLTLLVALVVYLKTKKSRLSLLIASMVMPAFILYAEFFMAYQGGGASMWPIALFVGSCIGFAVALVGVGLGMFIQKIVDNEKA
ncbi:hypothetical protein RF679_15695 [Undibacterium cyanobacteriorum]|uniref:Uncharacterized protein n=1 Tax=Undibacterium cyanobacteriorum TaxID=3073561 RepID=A0ABY9RFR7_9BURK|nr:hypothetical protein [Undibacterium sp. 20NA77.5]WMW80077.1 hypothetical protein RF679_15695 [Undibacterium sp. 20NA77.5]